MTWQLIVFRPGSLWELLMTYAERVKPKCVGHLTFTDEYLNDRNSGGWSNRAVWKSRMVYHFSVYYYNLAPWLFYSCRFVFVSSDLVRDLNLRLCSSSCLYNIYMLDWQAQYPLCFWGTMYKCMYIKTNTTPSWNGQYWTAPDIKIRGQLVQGDEISHRNPRINTHS